MTKIKGVLFVFSIIFSTSAQAQLADLMQQNRQAVEKQLEGDFAKMSREITPYGAIQSAWDNAKSSSGMRSVLYQDNEITKIQLRQNMVTTIVLPEWEEISQWIIGLNDTTVKVQKLSSNIISLQPYVVGVDTNFHIVGKTGIVYPFYLRTEGNNTKNITDQQIRVLLDEPEISKNKKEQEKTEILDKVKDDFVSSASKTWLRENDFEIDKIRHDLTMYGDENIAPFTVFRDDQFIYIDWGKNHEERIYPVVYQVIDDVNNPVSTRKTEDGRFLIVESTKNLALVYGKKVVCIKRIENI